MVRYIWNFKDGRYLWEDQTYALGARKELPLPKRNENVFVNIIHKIQVSKNGNTSYNVKLYYQDGQVIEGWYYGYVPGAIRIFGENELFDGRFNA